MSIKSDIENYEKTIARLVNELPIFQLLEMLACAFENEASILRNQKSLGYSSLYEDTAEELRKIMERRNNEI